jgi:hypothetical protein
MTLAIGSLFACVMSGLFAFDEKHALAPAQALARPIGAKLSQRHNSSNPAVDRTLKTCCFLCRFFSFPNQPPKQHIRATSNIT